MSNLTNSYQITGAIDTAWCINPNLYFEIMSSRQDLSHAVIKSSDLNWSIFSKLVLRFYREYILEEAVTTTLAEQELEWLKTHFIIHHLENYNRLEFTSHTKLTLKSREMQSGTLIFQYQHIGVLWRDLALSLDQFFKNELQLTGPYFRLLTTLRIIIPEHDRSLDVKPGYQPTELINFLPQNNLFLFAATKAAAEAPILKIHTNPSMGQNNLNRILGLPEDTNWVENEISGIKLPYLNIDSSQKHGPDNLFSYNRSLQNAATLENEKTNFSIHLREQKKQLTQKHYAVVKSVLAPEQVAFLRKYSRDLYTNAYFHPDDTQEINRSFIHSEPLMKCIHLQLTDIINQIVPEPVKPSYSFLCRYKHRSRLTKHQDRKQCLWNVSLPIDITGDDQEKTWPLHIEIDGKVESLHLDLGDIGIYQGSEYPHWRDFYLTGESATICFLHFVDQNYRDELN